MRKWHVPAGVPEKSDGFVTLLVVMAIMAVALMLMMRPYQRVKQHASEIQHQIHRAQSFWRAEGELACLWRQIVLSHGLITDGESCLESGDSLTVSGQRVRLIRVQNQDVSLEQRFRLPLPASSGVIKSSSRLIMTEPARFMPDPGEMDAEHHWPCVVLRYRDSFQAPSVSTYHPQDLSQKPYRDFPESGEQLCQANHRTLDGDQSHAGQDYQHDSTLNPFKDLFGIPRKEWEKIANKSHHVPSAHPVVWNEHCARQILRDIQQGDLIVWIDGGCFLSDDDIFRINQAIQMTFAEDGIILVIRDGALAVNSDRHFRGTMIQLMTPSHQSMKFTGWPDSPLYESLQPVIARYNMPLTQLSYFQSGSFFPLGGLYLDTPARYAVIDGVLDTRYARDLMLRPLSLIKPVAWMSGSWYVE